MDRTVYIVSHDKKYITNKTNVTRLWEVFEEIFGDRPLMIDYQENEDDEVFISQPARMPKIKKIALIAYKNRFHVYPTDEPDNKITVFQDIIGGRWWEKYM